MRYSIEPRTQKYVKRCEYSSFARNLSKKYRKPILDTGINASKKVIIKQLKQQVNF